MTFFSVSVVMCEPFRLLIRHSANMFRQMLLNVPLRFLPLSSASFVSARQGPWVLISLEDFLGAPMLGFKSMPFGVAVGNTNARRKNINYKSQKLLI